MSFFRPVDADSPLPASWRARIPYAVIFLVVVLAYAWDGLERVEFNLMDSRFRLSDRPASGQVVRVGIDSLSLRELNEWPWPRRHHAEVVRRLTDAGAARIVLDIDLSSVSQATDDAMLVEAIRDAGGKVVLPMFKQRAAQSNTTVYTEPLPMFRAEAQTASVNVRPEVDSLVRRYNRVEAWDGAFVPSLATQLSGQLPERFDPFYLDYSIRPESIDYLSYVDVMHGRFSAAAVAGKTVVVGATAVELGDMLAVPMFGAISGSLLQALAYESLVMGRAIERSAPAWSYIAGLLVVMFAGAMFPVWGWRRGLIVSLALAAGGYGTAAWVQYLMPLSLDISPPLLILGLGYLWSLIEKLDLQSLRLFKQHMAAVHRRAMMETVVDESFDGIVITNDEGRVDFVNQTACKLLGLQATDIEGRNIHRFMPRVAPVDEPDAQEIDTRAHAVVKSRQMTVENTDGSRIPVEYSTTRVFLAPGQSPFERRTQGRSVYVYTIHDMRESRKAQQALRTAAEKAVAADRAKSELLANVSHELRTPLNAIIGFSSVMQTEMFGPLGNSKYNEYVSDILFSGEHLLDLVNNLLTVSRMDSGKYNLSEEYNDLGALVEKCWHMISANPKATDIEFQAVISSDLPRVWADSNSMMQVLINLIGNAVKFTPAGGAIKVLAYQEDSGAVTLVVADTGIGIDAEDIAKITEPFEQVAEATSRDHGGAGLGLYIVKKLVEMHRAKMDISSEPDMGTRIAITFPRERSEGLDNVIELRSAGETKIESSA